MTRRKYNNRWPSIIFEDLGAFGVREILDCSCDACGVGQSSHLSSQSQIISFSIVGVVLLFYCLNSFENAYSLFNLLFPLLCWLRNFFGFLHQAFYFFARLQGFLDFHHFFFHLGNFSSFRCKLSSSFDSCWSSSSYNHWGNTQSHISNWSDLANDSISTYWICPCCSHSTIHPAIWFISPAHRTNTVITRLTLFIAETSIVFEFSFTFHGSGVPNDNFLGARKINAPVHSKFLAVWNRRSADAAGKIMISRFAFGVPNQTPFLAA